MLSRVLPVGEGVGTSRDCPRDEKPGIWIVVPSPPRWGGRGDLERLHVNVRRDCHALAPRVLATTDMNVMNNQKRNSAQPGFSLIEVIVAMSLAFFLMTGTAEMLALALKVHARARVRLDMTDLAAAKLEALRAETAAYSEGRGAPAVDGSASIAGRGNRQYRISWTFDPAMNSPRLVEICLSPTGPPANANLRIPFFISTELGF